MTPTQLQAYRRKHGLSWADVANLTGYSEKYLRVAGHRDGKVTDAIANALPVNPKRGRK